MLRIGIVGAENSHTVAIAKTINCDGLIADAQVVGVWGETPELAKSAAERGRIPQIMETPEAFIGKVDGVVVDHRHAKDHLPAAWPLLEAGVPLFIDKPFCYRVEEGIRFLKRASELDVPVVSFSVLARQRSFLQLQQQIVALGEMSAVVTTGPCDIRSQWGGVFFYGIHQVDMLLRLAGYDLEEVAVHQGEGKDHIATLRFASGRMASMNLIGSGSPKFHVTAIGSNGRIDATIDTDDNMYLSGIQAWIEMFRTGNSPDTNEEMLGPIAALEALEEAVAVRSTVPVPKFG